MASDFMVDTVLSPDCVLDRVNNTDLKSELRGSRNCIGALKMVNIEMISTHNVSYTICKWQL